MGKRLTQSPKAHVLHRRPNAVLTAVSINPRQPNHTRRYVVTVDGAPLVNWNERSPTAAWAEASKYLFRIGENWNRKRD